MASIAYFSMEIGVLDEVPTYAGGLGVLAGDTLRSAGDVGASMVGVTLLYRQGYFRQRIDAAGRQTEERQPWNVQQALTEQPARAAVTIEGRTVWLRCWRYVVTGAEVDVPVYFLDTDLPEIEPADRALTDVLYGGDQRYRLSQETVLGIGGVRMLRALGYRNIDRFHERRALEPAGDRAAARAGARRGSDGRRAGRCRCGSTPVHLHDAYAGGGRT